jgi:tRNA threonylcarbamoyladenosine biosynthesis protein TsaB
VLGIGTLEAIAHGVPPEVLSADQREIHAVLDAQRRELFVGRFRGAEISAGRADDLPTLTRVAADKIIAAEQWLGSLTAGVLVTGAGVTKLEQQLPPGILATPISARQPRAAVVGHLAWRDYQTGRRDDLWKLAPVYLRPSYAEEKAAAGGCGASSNRDHRSRL